MKKSYTSARNTRNGLCPEEPRATSPKLSLIKNKRRESQSSSKPSKFNLSQIILYVKLLYIILTFFYFSEMTRKRNRKRRKKRKKKKSPKK